MECFYKTMAAIAVFFIIILCNADTIRASILDNYPPDLKDRHVMSCRSRCGQEAFPCSCKSRCLVYKNCCEDFMNACPKEFDDTEKFSHVLNTDIVCSARNRVFMVSSCDLDTYDAINFRHTSSLGPAIDTAETFSTSEKTTHPLDLVNAEFQRKINSRPVVDLYNGVTFTDYETFSCNSVVNQSVPLLWDILVRIKSGQSFSNIPDFTDMTPNVLDSLPYILPSHAQAIESEISVPCPIDRIHDNCPLQSRESDGGLYHKCRNLKSYIYLRDSRGNKTFLYQNIYCVKCADFETEKLTVAKDMAYRIPDTGLLAVMSLTAEGVSFTPRKNDSLVPWREIVCSFNASEGLDIFNTPCLVERSAYQDPGNVDGLSSYKRKLAIAVDSGGLRLTAYQLPRLPIVYACVMERHSYTTGVAVDKDQGIGRTASKVSDVSLNRTLYFFEANVQSRIPFRSDVEGIATMRLLRGFNKALYEYLMRTASEENEMSLDRDTEGGSLQSVADVRENPQTDPDLENTFVPERSVVCMCVIEQAFEEPCDLSCEDSTRSHRQDEDEIDALKLASDCFGVLRSSLGSSERKMAPFLVFGHLLLAAVTLVLL